MDWVWFALFVDVLLGAPSTMLLIGGVVEIVRKVRRRRACHEIPALLDELAAELEPEGIALAARWDAPTVTLAWLSPASGPRFVLRDQKDHDPWANAARRLVGLRPHFEVPPPGTQRLTDQLGELRHVFGTRFASSDAAAALEARPDTVAELKRFDAKWRPRLSGLSLSHAGVAIIVRAGNHERGKQFLHTSHLREMVTDLATAVRSLPTELGPGRALPAELQLRKCPQCQAHHQDGHFARCLFCGLRPNQTVAARLPASGAVVA